jgi:hypothetical protein
MPEVIVFRQLTVQTARISGPTLQLFTDADRTARRAVEDPERVLVRWLMDKETVRNVVLEELRRAPGSFTDTAITHPLIENTNRKPGDIDLLICDPNRPDESLVVEWKRVKASVRGDGTNQVNRLDDVGGGVAQANALYELGFFQTCLGVLTVVDAHQQVSWNIPNRGIDSGTTSNYSGTNTFKSIIEFPRREELRDDIGILFVEIVQPTGRALDDLFTVRICVHRQPVPKTQRTNTTNRVREFLRGKGR